MCTTLCSVTCLLLHQTSATSQDYFTFDCIKTRWLFHLHAILQVLALHDVSSTDASIIYTAEPVLGAGFAYFLLGMSSSPTLPGDMSATTKLTLSLEI